MAQVLDRGGRRAVGDRTVRSAAQLQRVSAAGDGQLALASSNLCLQGEVVLDPLGGHINVQSHHPRHLLHELQRHHQLRQLPLRPGDAHGVRSLLVAEEEGAEPQAALPRADEAPRPGALVPGPIGVPHLCDGHCELEGVCYLCWVDGPWHRSLLYDGRLQV